ncbi:hypothetical protein VZC37_16440 [Gordonia sp. LSe1-13]|uniref:Restriction endonuclease type IV Mrr domain-containing protein n=1 Tax=Gordonia sesuvii TaxID=3116777 RepID=A0ABU7MFX4_9ACTN|nr:hypothetical protein [Gordonia sp. LSe1-13]
MSTARIPWSRLDSGELEHTVAMLVCADNPTGQKFTPGPDGGIDIFVPDGEARRKVFQVKNFALKFNNTEFRQVRKSLNSVADTATSEGWEITEWHLVTPRDPSPGYFAQIAEVVTSLMITSWSWMGLTQLDILAGRHPDLVDYYLNGGKDRLVEQLADLTAIIRGDGTATPDQRLQPSDVGERIRTLARAANNDPHFRYHFETSDGPPVMTEEPWLVAVAAEQQGPLWLHIKVYAKFLAALDERPVTTRVRVNTAGNPELAQSFEQFLDFGTDVHIPADAASAELDMPGNLGGVVDSAEIRIGASSSEGGEQDSPPRLIIGARDPGGAVVAELLLHRTESSTGVRGGLRTVWADDAELFTLEVRHMPGVDEIDARISMSWDVSGRLPADLIDSFAFMDALERDVCIGISPSHGPRRYGFGTPLQHARDSDLHLTARVVSALSIIQQHCTDLLRMPAEVSTPDLKRLFEAATLLQGRPATATWAPFGFTVDAVDGPALIPGARINVAVTTPLTVTLDDSEHDLGLVASFLDATVDSVDGSAVILRPYDSSSKATRVLTVGDAHRVWVDSSSIGDTTDPNPEAVDT